KKQFRRRTTKKKKALALKINTQYWLLFCFPFFVHIKTGSSTFSRRPIKNCKL
ncbi:hypothetical protein S245_040058, partial [Arachis hypogaea]